MTQGLCGFLFLPGGGGACSENAGCMLDTQVPCNSMHVIMLCISV